jgi:hypothetical protein
LGGCDVGAIEEVFVDPLSSYTASAISEDGIAAFPVEIGPGIRSVMLTGESDDARLSIDRIVNPEGEVVLDWRDWSNSNESVTNALWPYYKDLAANWPIRIEDGDLDPGTWTLEVATSNTSGQYIDDAEVEVTIQTMTDESPESGSVNVRIVWADGVDNDEDLVEDVQAAVERWREIWAMYGLQLVETWASSELDDGLRYNGLYDAEIEDEAEKGTDSDLLLILGEEIDGDAWLYGLAGGIPGTPLPSKRSAVGVSWLAHAGQDGRLSDDEISMMGETMAHEIGHFMGLFHPVEDGAQYFDALDDTSECSSMSQCDSRLSENLMYPYPVCTSWTNCVAQEEVSEEQAGVLQRYIATY